MDKLTERFLRHTAFPTMSDGKSPDRTNSAKQSPLARFANRKEFAPRLTDRLDTPYGADRFESVSVETTHRVTDILIPLCSEN